MLLAPALDNDTTNAFSQFLRRAADVPKIAVEGCQREFFEQTVDSMVLQYRANTIRMYFLTRAGLRSQRSDTTTVILAGALQDTSAHDLLHAA